MTENSISTTSNRATHLPAVPVLSTVLHRSDSARKWMDWLLIGICILSCYGLMKSQLDYGIESTALPTRKPEEKKNNPQPMKQGAFIAQKKTEPELWLELKNLLERKKPVQGNCQIGSNRGSNRESTRGSTHGSNRDPHGNHTGYELACWIYSNKKSPSNHSGLELLDGFEVLGSSPFSTDLPLKENKEAIRTTRPNFQAPVHEAHESSPITPEGWIQTPTGILRFDAKDERWK